MTLGGEKPATEQGREEVLQVLLVRYSLRLLQVLLVLQATKIGPRCST